VYYSRNERERALSARRRAGISKPGNKNFFTTTGKPVAGNRLNKNYNYIICDKDPTGQKKAG
jgi:hypothetical protein